MQPQNGPFERALELNPRNAAAMTNLANLNRDAGNIEDAKFQYLRALEVDASNAVTHYNLAFLYEEEGETGKAVQHFTRFLNLGSNLYPNLVTGIEDRIQALSRTEP